MGGHIKTLTCMHSKIFCFVYLKFGCLCAVSMISRSFNTALVIEPSLSLWVSKMDQLHAAKEKYR
ncbi:hypothetical protein ES288_D10G176200v1 [Gossypium darwinii]|uniref:Uncharacterized protein n=1 Tax=Gossypium darwinii TaxID=34276 RepID=A0A5D2B127_GOSDA|nr:hypothetical protein ES288_D10G176200v1 [Gossypium darwinii]